jgi:hypothetical protein
MRSKRNMKKIILLIMFVLCSLVQASEIKGTFSAKNGDMKCRGMWDHPFLPMARNYTGKIPSSPLLANEVLTVSVSQQSQGVKIVTYYVNGEVNSISSFSGLSKGIRINQKDGLISLKQYDALDVILDYGYYVGIKSNIRFKALLMMNENNDLVIENYYGAERERMVLKISCIMPRISRG